MGGTGEQGSKQGTAAAFLERLQADAAITLAAALLEGPHAVVVEGTTQLLHSDLTLVEVPHTVAHDFLLDRPDTVPHGLQRIITTDVKDFAS